MKVGDLVRMDCTGDYDYTADEWGVGIVLKTNDRTNMIAVHWSAIGLSWEHPIELELVDENR